jgi:putative transposase
MVLGRQVCGGAGDGCAERDRAGGILPSQGTVRRADRCLAERLHVSQRQRGPADARPADASEGRQKAHPAVGKGIATQGESAGRSGSAADPAKKSPGDLGAQRGRLTSVPDRLLCVELIREAAAAGSRLEPACAELEISLRTFQRWVRDGDDAVAADSRTTGKRPVPANKLSKGERAQILAVANSEEFASLPPSQIVPALADQGVYVASESSFYRVLKAAAQQHHRGRAKKPSGRVVTSHCAAGPNQVWSWDISVPQQAA